MLVNPCRDARVEAHDGCGKLVTVVMRASRRRPRSTHIQQDLALILFPEPDKEGFHESTLSERLFESRVTACGWPCPRHRDACQTRQQPVSSRRVVANGQDGDRGFSSRFASNSKLLRGKADNSFGSPAPLPVLYKHRHTGVSLLESARLSARAWRWATAEALDLEAYGSSSSLVPSMSL